MYSSINLKTYKHVPLRKKNTYFNNEKCLFNFTKKISYVFLQLFKLFNNLISINIFKVLKIIKKYFVKFCLND